MDAHKPNAPGNRNDRLAAALAESVNDARVMTRLWERLRPHIAAKYPDASFAPMGFAEAFGILLDTTATQDALSTADRDTEVQPQSFVLRRRIPLGSIGMQVQFGPDEPAPAPSEDPEIIAELVRGGDTWSLNIATRCRALMLAWVALQKITGGQQLRCLCVQRIVPGDLDSPDVTIELTTSDGAMPQVDIYVCRQSDMGRIFQPGKSVQAAQVQRWAQGLRASNTERLAYCSMDP